jgi:steroid delta-isomerase-like uncharacterized protein
MSRRTIGLAVAVMLFGLGLSTILAISSRAQEATPAADCAADTAASETLVQRWYEEVWTAGTVGVLDELVVDDHHHHWAVGPDTTGQEPLKERIAAWRDAFPDLEVTMDEVIAREDLVAVRWTARGTNGGTFQGHEPTGKVAEWAGINVFRVECGQIVEAWSEMDALGLYQQLGVMDAESMENDS